MTYIITLILAFCSIVYELLLGQTLSAFFGNTVLRYSVTIGLYLFAMGMGIGGYIKEMNGVSYIEYIAPGLIVTSAMYSATFECTFGSYTRLTSQRTTISIAHRLSTLKQANRLVVLDHGKVTECGTHRELMANDDGAYRKLADMNAAVSSIRAVAG